MYQPKNKKHNYRVTCTDGTVLYEKGKSHSNVKLAVKAKYNDLEVKTTQRLD